MTQTPIFPASPAGIKSAAQIIVQGGIVAFPTETVYWLGADVFNVSAIKKVFAAKNRPADNPLIVHVASVADILLVAREIPADAQKLIDAFFPWPLTVLLPKKPQIDDIITAGSDFISVRMPNHALARAFIAACQTPLVGPSANYSGKPSPTSTFDVLQTLNGRIDGVLDGGKCNIGLESTVVGFIDGIATILRPGFITLSQIQSILPSAQLHSHTSASSVPASPGTKYRHYAPNASIVLASAQNLAKHIQNALQNGKKTAVISLVPVTNPAIRHYHMDSVADYAQQLYGIFHTCDTDATEIIIAETVEETELWLALMNRLKKAASGK